MDLSSSPVQFTAQSRVSYEVRSSSTVLYPFLYWKCTKTECAPDCLLHCLRLMGFPCSQNLSFLILCPLALLLSSCTIMQNPAPSFQRRPLGTGELVLSPPKIYFFPDDPVPRLARFSSLSLFGPRALITTVASAELVLVSECLLYIGKPKMDKISRCCSTHAE